MITNAQKGVLASSDAIAVDVTVAPANLAVCRNRFPFLWPNLTASSVYLESGAGLSIAPAPKTSRFSISQAPPCWVSVEIDGQFWINTQTGTARNLYQLHNNEWQPFGQYSSPPAALASQYVLNGGNSAAVDAAIIATGSGGQLQLTGSFTLTRPISLEFAGLVGNITLIFNSATITYSGVTITQPTPTLTSVSYPASSYTFNPATTSSNALLTNLLVNASFSR